MKRTQKTSPTYCPGCGKPVSQTTHAGVCAYCGDRLAPKGYCPVCEDFLPLSAGDFCPKHQIELESDAPSPSGGLPAYESAAWVEVGRYSDTLACQPPRIRLEAEGIPTMIDGERMGDRSMYQVATGGVRLRVPENLAADARVILSQTWTATAAALDIEDDWSDDEDETPTPESHILQHISDDSSPLLSLAAFALFLALILVVAAFLSWFKAN
jgi:hypothetical protein